MRNFFFAKKQKRNFQGPFILGPTPVTALFFFFRILPELFPNSSSFIFHLKFFFAPPRFEPLPSSFRKLSLTPSARAVPFRHWPKIFLVSLSAEFLLKLKLEFLHFSANEYCWAWCIYIQLILNKYKHALKYGFSTLKNTDLHRTNEIQHFQHKKYCFALSY